MTLTTSKEVEKVVKCRACDVLLPSAFLELGTQPLSGVFPLKNEPDPISGPLDLVKCSNCHLIQLQHNYPLSQMYGDNYGYRSGLNGSMSLHLQNKARKLASNFAIGAEAIVVDIGSNDGTLLNSLVNHGCDLVGIDPTISKFHHFYHEKVIKMAEFFSAQKYLESFSKADLVFSISMLYDLPHPQEFIQDVSSILKPNGIWHFEQSYLPSMIKTNSYDTICHEHLEYYSINSLKFMLDRAELKIIDLEFNSINGGSFAVTVAKRGSNYDTNPLVDWFLLKENALNLDESEIYETFSRQVLSHVNMIREFFTITSSKGIQVCGLGASTKGNVLINASGINDSFMSAIVDVNEYKWDRVTPGSRIAIISEEEFTKRKFDLAFVLPWHFKTGFIARYQEFMAKGGKLIFPLPDFEVLGD